jgi:hypothetical protein
MGLLSSSSRSKRTTNNNDNRTVNDASGGGVAGNTGTVNITTTDARLVADGMTLARSVIEAGSGVKVTQTALVVAGVAIVGVAMLARR